MSYLRFWLDPGQAEKAARKAAKLLRPLEFDTIACRGISGALIAAPLGLRLKKNLFVVRKGETTHGDPQEFIAPVRSYVIVDDFIDSGATLDAIIDGVEKKYPEAKLLGVLFSKRVLLEDYEQDRESYSTPQGRTVLNLGRKV